MYEALTAEALTADVCQCQSDQTIVILYRYCNNHRGTELSWPSNSVCKKLIV